MLPFSGRLRRRPPACENSIVIVTQCNKIAFQPVEVRPIAVPVFSLFPASPPMAKSTVWVVLTGKPFGKCAEL